MIFNYRLLNAAIGSSKAALRAGSTPKVKPIEPEITTVNNITSEFIEILEGPFGITGCLKDIDCEQILNCNIITPLEKINSKIYNVFNEIKLNQIT